MKEWINCEDLLPEPGDYGILVFWPENGAIETVHCEDYFGDITCGKDLNGVQLYTKWYISAGVTHWMKLPEPPKTLTDKEREMWNKEARAIEGERK